ncbi:hypothetical protein SAMN06295955_1086 [Sphingopyxis indica]|uniref:Uncharacterized protein n=1 Tax=Sphingopyxis indica TaxID=436663 RepID=A0A239II55_9SPHN|nr:hypothetical protein SAMN06295955_1086 [Sphingopyxis indica]
METDPYMRIQSVKLFERQVQATAGKRQQYTHLKISSFPLLYRRSKLNGLAKLLRADRGLFEKQLPGGGETNTASATIEDAKPDAMFQQLHAPRQRRLRDVEG